VKSKLLYLFSISVYVFLMLPIIIIVIMSFSENPFFFPPTTYTLAAYMRAFAREEILGSLNTSVILAIISTAISLPTGFLCSYVLVRHKFRGSGTLRLFLLSPLTTPKIVLGLALILFFVLIGILNAWINLIIGHFIITFPYVIRILGSGLIGVNVSIEEAAMNLGADRIKTFLKITVPTLKSSFLAASVFCFITSFENESVSLFLVDSKTITLPITLLTMVRYELPPEVFAVGAFIILLTIVFVTVVERVARIDLTTVAGQTI
jgi:putative spermidine/putrescine transport system permease protein